MKTCWRCNNENSDESSFCSKCGANLDVVKESNKKPISPFYVITISIIVICSICIVISIVGIIAIFANQKAISNINNQPISVRPTIEYSQLKNTEKPLEAVPEIPLEPTGEPIPSPNVPSPTNTLLVGNLSGSIGQDVRIGDVRWKIIEANNLGSTLKSDNQFVDDLITTGKFIKTRFEIENLGKELKSFSTMILIDSIGREYHPSSVYQFIPDTEESFIVTNLNPNLTKTITEIYEVASDAQGLRAKISNLEFIGAEYGYVDLGIQ